MFRYLNLKFRHIVNHMFFFSENNFLDRRSQSFGVKSIFDGKFVLGNAVQRSLFDFLNSIWHKV